MNASVGAAPTWPAGVTGWNDSMDHTLHDFQLDGAEVSWDNASDGGGSATNESEYDYDYETALDTFFWSQLAPPLAVYAATYVVGVAGNGLIIFTICRFRRLKTTTNVFLASLASADLLLILLCIPVKVSRLTSRQPCLSPQPMTRGRTAAAGWPRHSPGLPVSCHRPGIWFAVRHSCLSQSRQVIVFICCSSTLFT